MFLARVVYLKQESSLWVCMLKFCFFLGSSAFGEELFTLLHVHISSVFMYNHPTISELGGCVSLRFFVALGDSGGPIPPPPPDSSFVPLA